MAQPVRVEFLRSADAGDAFESFGAHGLTAELVDGDDGWEIEIATAEEEAERAVTEVTHALDDWLLERDLPFIPTRIDERRLTVRPPAD